jgi:hypothetical protein
MGATVARGSHTLLVSSRLRHPGRTALARVNKASMCGVGTELGTIEVAQNRG